MTEQKEQLLIEAEKLEYRELAKMSRPELNDMVSEWFSLSEKDHEQLVNDTRVNVVRDYMLDWYSYKQNYSIEELQEFISQLK